MGMTPMRQARPRSSQPLLYQRMDPCQFQLLGDSDQRPLYSQSDSVQSSEILSASVADRRRSEAPELDSRAVQLPGDSSAVQLGNTRVDHSP
jgi:hypothetical protein